MSEFFLDMEAVNEEAERMNNAGGSAKYFSRKDIPANGDVDIRLMPPLKSLNGLFYLKRIQIWINKKPYISPRTFGLKCPILDMQDEIIDSGDIDLNLLIEAKSYNVSEDYILPILLLNPKTMQVVDECVKTFDCTWGLIKALNNIITNRAYQNNSPLGIFDPKIGYNLIISKTVTSDNTSYSALVAPKVIEMDAKYYEEVPDVVEDLKKKVYSDKYLNLVAKSYFLGQAMPHDDLKFEGKTKIETEKPDLDNSNSQTEAKSTTETSTTETSEKGMSLIERLNLKKG